MFDTDDSMENDFVENIYRQIQKRTRMKTVAKELLENEEYASARDIFHKLLYHLEDRDAQLDTLLQIAECDVMIGKKIEPETDMKIMTAIETCERSSYDLRDMAKLQQHGLSAVISFLYSCKTLKAEPDANKAVSALETCTVYAVHEIAEMLKNPKLRRKACKSCYLLPRMAEGFETIYGGDIDRNVHAEAKCLTRIGYIFNDAGMYRDSIPFLKRGRELMSNHFGPDAPKYEIYAAMANNLGFALTNTSEDDEAIFYHKKAVLEVKLAEDVTEEVRRHDLENYSKGLRANRSSFTSHAAVDDTWAGLAETYRDEKPTLRNTGSNSDRLNLTELREVNDHEYLNSQLKLTLQQANREIENGNEVTQETNRNILSHFQSLGSTWGDVRKMAIMKHGIPAVVLHVYTCKLLPFMEHPDKVVEEIGESFRLSYNTSKQVITIYDGRADAIISLLNGILSELKRVNGGARALKSRVEAECLKRLGSLCNYFSLYELAVKYLSEGRTIMENSFAFNASRHAVYASLAFKLGYAFEKMGDYQKSTEHYENALTEVRTANDIDDITKKKKTRRFEKPLQTPIFYAEGQRPVSKEESRSRLNENQEEDILEVKHKDTLPASERKPDSLVHVGGEIYVDHTRQLKKDSQVYEGKFQGENVAVKKLEHKHKKEVEIMVKLAKHPNVIDYKQWSVMEYRETPGLKSIYVAMEQCDTKTLFELAKDNNFTDGDRIRSLLHFTQGLCHIHKHDVIHGDLKPNNIIRARDGVFKIADFGICKKLEGGRTHFTFTASLSRRSGWFAPDRKLTKKSDVYAAGAIYYYVLSKGDKCFAEGLSKLHCPNVDVVKDLISLMTDTDANKRPTANECLESPLFRDVT